MDKATSDFIALKEIADRMEADPANLGWYMHRAYMLGCGSSIDEVLEMPPKARTHGLTVIKGGKS